MSLYFSSGALKSATICFVALLSSIFPLPESLLTHAPWKKKWRQGITSKLNFTSDNILVCLVRSNPLNNFHDNIKQRQQTNLSRPNKASLDGQILQYFKFTNLTTLNNLKVLTATHYTLQSAFHSQVVPLTHLQGKTKGSSSVLVCVSIVCRCMHMCVVAVAVVDGVEGHTYTLHLII